MCVCRLHIKDKLESVLDVSHQQMEQYRDQPAHAEKIAYQQKLLQEDVVHIRAEISQVSTVRNEAAHTFIMLQMKSAALSLSRLGSNYNAAHASPPV